MGKGITRKRINAKRGSATGGGGSGTVTSIGTTGPITGGPITTTGTIGFDQGANFTWTGSHTFTISLPTSVIVPTNADDLVNKAYVDSLIAGLSPQPSVLVATVAPLPACTPAGAGVGKTLTMNAVGILTVDGVATVLGDNILVKDQVDPINNGVYTVTTEGTAGVAAVLTRRTNYDQDAEVLLGTMFGVSQGTQAGTVWVMISPDPVVVDTDPILFTYFLTGATYSAGTGLTLGGNTFAVDVDPAGGIIFNGNQIAVNPDTVTIDIVGNQLTFVGSSTDVSNASLVAGATVTDALNNLAGTLGLDLQTVLTNGNVTTLSADFNDGLGNRVFIDPFSFTATDGVTSFTIVPSGGTSEATSGVNTAVMSPTGFSVTNGVNNIVLNTSGIITFGNPLGIDGAYTIPVTDGTSGQVLTTDGAGVASWGTVSASISIVPILAAGLLALASGNAMDTGVIYQVLDAGEGTSTVTGILNIMAEDPALLQPQGQGLFTNTYSTAIPCILGYDLATNKFTSVIEPVRNNKVFCGLDSQSLDINDTALRIFHFDDVDWRDNTFNNARFDNADQAAAGSLLFKGCNFETIWIDFNGHDDIEAINQIFKGTANQLSGVPDWTVTGDVVSLECNDFYGSDSDVAILNMGNGADITYCRVGWFSTVNMNDIANADMRFCNVGSTAYVDIQTALPVRYNEFGNGIYVECVGSTLNCNFLSGDQGGTLGVSGFKGSQSTLINCNYGGNNSLTCNTSVLNGCTVSSGAGSNNVISLSNLSKCTVNFGGFSNCTLSGVTAQNQTITFTGNGQVINTVNMVHKFADATARDAAITLPLAGMMCVIGTNLSYYHGSAWVNL